jgi:hypothetical protein
MSRSRLVLALVSVTILVVGIAGFLGFAALRSSSSDQSSTTGGGSDPLVQRNSGGGVEIAATLATPGRLKTIDPAKSGLVDLGAEVAIILTLDTHQGDLRSFDFASAAGLVAKDGTEEKPVRWIVVNDNAHHLEGMLVFTRKPRSATTLALRGLSGVAERIFNFPPQS